MKTLDKKTTLRIVGNIVYPIIALGIILAVWAIIAKVYDSDIVLPMPSVVLKRFFTLGTEKYFWLSVSSSLLRTLICFVISFVTALLFAAISAVIPPINKIMAPIVTLFRAAPTVAVILIIYAFMNNSTMAVTVGFLVAFPIMYSSFYSAITNVDKDLVEMAKLYKVSNANIISSIYIPCIAPTLFDTSKSTISLSLKIVVAAEILASVNRSMGGKIQTANVTFEMDYLLAWTLVAIVFSFVLEIIVSMLKKIWEVRR